MIRRWSIVFAVAVLLSTSVPLFASDTRLSGADGHPRSRFPLAIHVASTGDPALDGAASRAVRDWNTVAHEALGIDAFSPVAQLHGALVVATYAASTRRGLMGETDIEVRDHVIALPVRIDIAPPEARGQTSRETVLYQVLAHELGHALGLDHVRDPASIMCCVAGSVDFKDPVAREAYVKARRHPDVRSAAAQLKAHYARVRGSSAVE